MPDAQSPPIPVIVNAAAGLGNGPRQIESLQEQFREAGLNARIMAVRSGGELRSVVKSAARDKPRMIVAGGGDGTLGTVAGLLKDTGIALGVLPLGTFNHFARDLRIPVNTKQAIETLAAGYAIEVDVGDVNGKVFLNNSSLGIYPDMVRERKRQQTRLGHGKRWALFWASLTAMRRSAFLHVRLRLNGSEREYRTPFVFIGNNRYVMEGFNIGVREGLRDGLLSVYVTQRRTRLGLVGLGIRALFARLHQANDFEAMTAQTLSIASRHHFLPVATDGEVSLMETPLDYRVLPLALRVVVPKPAET
jgi:YegS/Rv2252/BmrU family lipid kinase